MFPRPRRVRRNRGYFTIPKSINLKTIGRDRQVLRRIARLAGQMLRDRARIDLTHSDSGRNPTLLIEQAKITESDQAYVIEIDPKSMHIRGATESALRFALLTLRQLFSAGQRRIAAMRIEDWPDFPVRGVMLDVSRDKVPKMDELLRLVDLFADWKLNQLQLYMEHTFAYRGHKVVWREASPFTPSEIRRLDRYCRDRGIELVPNQNSFGHMERWLCHAKYAPLAETNQPWKTPWGTMRDKPTTLCPLDRGSIRLVADLYDQLLPNLKSSLFNVGCDETWELGQGRSRAACTRRGKGRVYLDYLNKVYREVRRRNHRMMFWADIIMQYPALIRSLPKDAVVLIWGYEADHPFANECRKVAATKLSFYVCPGTSSWCSFAGRTTNSRANLRVAAKHGLANGAEGYLITDWGDFGHRQYLPASYAPLLEGAGRAWCAKSNDSVDVASEVDHRIHKSGDGLAKLWLDAGDVYLATGVSLKNRTILFSIMETPLAEIPALKGISAAGLRRTSGKITAIQKQSRPIKPMTPEAELSSRELAATLRVLAHACKRGRTALNPELLSKECNSLARDMRAIITEHRRLWRMRNRPGGLPSSLSYYEKMLSEYDGEAARPSSSKRRQK